MIATRFTETLFNYLIFIQLLDMLRAAGFYKISFEIKSEALKGVPSGT